MANLSFNIDANTAPAQSNVGKLGKTFDELGEEILRVVDASKRAGETNEQIADQIARAYGVPLDNARRGVDRLDEILQQAGRAGRRASDDITDGLQDVQRQARRTGDEVDDISTGGRGFGKLGEVGREVSQELGQNFGEAVSSIRGNLGDLGQVGQDTLGGLAATVAGFGPAGLIGALGLGAGAAIWGAFAQGAKDAADKQQSLNDKVRDFGPLYANSINGVANAAAILAGIQDIQGDPEKYRDAAQAAADWGVSVPVAMRAIAGDATALAIAQESLNQQMADGTGLNAAEQNLNGISGSLTSVTQEAQRGQEKIDNLSQALGVARQQAADGSQALYQLATSNGTATGATDDLGNAIIALPDNKQVVVNANTGQAYENLDALEQKRINDKTFTLRALLDTTAIDRYTPPQKIGYVNYKAAQTAWDGA